MVAVCFVEESVGFYLFFLVGKWEVEDLQVVLSGALLLVLVLVFRTCSGASIVNCISDWCIGKANAFSAGVA